MGQKLGGLCPFGRGGAGSPSNTMWPGPRPTCMPSFSVIVWHLSSGRQQNFVAFSRWHHLYSAWRPSRWSSAHILVLSFFSSPNLSGRRLDVYHTSTHGVALVQIYNADLKCAGRCLLKIQDTKKIAKNSPSAHHHTTLSGCILATKAHIDNRTKTVKQQYLPQTLSQYGELRPL